MDNSQQLIDKLVLCVSIFVQLRYFIFLFEQVSQMEKSGALGVVVVATDEQVVQDMNCDGTECQNQLSIPATFIEYSGQILQ